MKTFDPTKPVRCLDKRYNTTSPARIICTDREGGRPIIALVKSAGGFEMPHAFSTNGQSMSARRCLENVPERKVATRHVFHSPNYSGGVFTTHPGDFLYDWARVGKLDFITEEGEFIDVVFTKEGSAG